ncbi:MAG: VIT and VWA domain-containing protein [Acidobacteriota bacterium]|nr:VIT and VWA domain-containing protein [Acidobacteriota bacterium]
MQRNFFFKLLPVLAISAATILAFATLRSSQVTVTAAQESETQGALQVLDATGNPKAICPLKHTSVKAEISGFVSRVVVTQEFENPFKEKIEAVYTFPLPQNAAVDDMTMLVGDRTVRGRVLRREEAQAVYEAAKTGGKVASLLDQERPNIFTQSVANIMPGEHIKITISYVETLKYEDGSYEFVYPMVVGPRYIPGNATASPVSGGNGFAPDTDSVPDASRITPRPVAKGMRVGHDISLEVALDAGVAIENVSSGSHAIDMQRPGVAQAHVRLKNSSVIPNKDFILRYDVAGKSISDALLTHRSERGGFFTLILQPPDRVTVTDVTPKELVFVIDTSGSMSGFPIEKAKETMKLALDSLYPADTFNLITFAGDTHILFPAPVPATRENLQKAQSFLASRSGGGGTEMMKAIKTALDPSDAQGHVRIVCFMTDGYIGNDMEIIAEVRNHPNARVFAFGIGNSVNRFLLDKMAEQGRGEVEYVALSDDGSAAARRFHERVRNPLLTDISVEWNGLPVADVYPQRIPDLFGAKPVILTGRYTSAGSGVIRLKGKMSGREFVRDISVAFPEAKTQHDVLAPLWARARIDDLMGQDFNGLQRGTMRPDLKDTITNLGLEYRLMTQFTSFVAVEEMIVTDGGTPRRIDVPVEVPDGVSRAGVFGEEGERAQSRASRTMQNFALTTSSGTRVFSGRPVGSVSAAKSKDERGGSVGGGGGGGVGVGAGRGGGIAAASPMPAQMTVSDADALDRAKLSPDEEKRQLLFTKLHPSILGVVERLKTKATPGADEMKFIRGEKAEIQIWLTDKTPEALAKLKELGFEVILDPKSAKLVIGRLPIENLQKLAELKFVRYVAPQISS